MNRLIRQPLPWTIIDGSEYVLPARGASRYRLSGVCITAPLAPPTSCLIAVIVEDGGGNVAGRYEGLADVSTATVSLTFASNGPSQPTSPFVVGSLAFLPPDLWIEPWHRVKLQATNSAWPDAVTVVTCELENED